MTLGTVLLHLCTPGEWRGWLDTGAVAPASLDEAGFVHLSTPEQVALPAQRLFAGRTDLVLLVLDPARIDAAGIEVRWQPGVPTDPASMRFPHAYGPVPASAVLAVAPYRPGPGGFADPDVPGPTAATRAMGFEASMLRRGADEEEPVVGGVAVRTLTFPASRMHNQLLVDRPDLTGRDALRAEADRTLAAHGLHPGALLWGAVAAELAGALRAAGWSVGAHEAMTAPVRAGAPASGGTGGTADELDHEAVRDFRLASRARGLPGATPDALAQLVDRDLGDDRRLALHRLAVRSAGRVVAALTLRRDGATAWLDGLETDPAHRGRGHGRALLAAAHRLAADHGCDLLALGADPGDRPHDWYLRSGFTVVGTHYEGRA
ncbi:GNAT family N-acetyltransferase [Pseudonocardia sp. HH130629-09]|uniref:GNAT family N-acetyltransferase n=1 Tax=Pseudonocardia sp. HH130629-09 TaxID=1641402 RepID=UPI0006CB31AC|nr:GNAT family N-acetyltransferase [Pseudonocardia sp. HH130629-09]ALE81704.1 hypothetical protein XF36_00060 [Pseudonocardia sp. HH130629-09]